jgi:hypothetical protein
LTESAASASVNLDAGEAPAEEGSDYDEGEYDDFGDLCIANPAYFHVCMFAEASYFLIDGLKRLSKRLFRKSFALNMNEDIIQETIEELYSDRFDHCDYQELKEVAIPELVKLLSNPNIKNNSLMSFELRLDFPDFAQDLCTAVIAVADQPIDNPETPNRGAARPAIEHSS